MKIKKFHKIKFSKYFSDGQSKYPNQLLKFVVKNSFFLSQNPNPDLSELLLLNPGLMNRFWLNTLSKAENEEFMKNGTEGDGDK